MTPNSCWKKDDLYKELGNVEEQGVQLMTGISIQILKFDTQSPSTLFSNYG